MVGLRAKQKAQRETRILDAALSVFRARGFDAARMEQIAEMAELSTGTLYNYFPTKGDLLVAIVGLETVQTLDAGDAIVADPPSDAQDAVLALARAWYEHSFRLLDRRLWRHAFAMMMERPRSQSSVRFAQNDSLLQHQAAALIAALQVKGHVRADLDAVDAGLCVFNLIDRTFMTYISDDEMGFEDLMRLLARQVAITGLNAGAAG